MSDNTCYHVLFLSLQEDRNGISLTFQQRCKQDIKMQIADITIDNFHNIRTCEHVICKGNVRMWGIALIEHRETGMGG